MEEEEQQGEHFDGNIEGPTMTNRLCTLSLDPSHRQRLIYTWPNKEFLKVDGFKLKDNVYDKISSRIWNSKMEVTSAGMAHYSVFLNVSYPTDKQFGHIPITIQKNHGLTG